MPESEEPVELPDEEAQTEGTSPEAMQSEPEPEPAPEIEPAPEPQRRESIDQEASRDPAARSAPPMPEAPAPSSPAARDDIHPALDAVFDRLRDRPAANGNSTTSSRVPAREPKNPMVALIARIERLENWVKSNRLE